MNLLRNIKDTIGKNRIGVEWLLLAGQAQTDLRTFLKINKEWEYRENEWPSSLNIENINLCNANCIFCAYQYQQQWRSEKGVISDDLFHYVVAAHKKMGGKFLGIAPMQGDPLLDKKILYKITAVIRSGMETSFFTNGILLETLDFQQFAETGISSFTLSTSPFDKELFEKIYRSRKYERLLGGLIAYLKYRNEHRINIKLNLGFRSPLSYQETLNLPDFRDKVKPLLSQEEIRKISVVNSFDDWCGQIKSADLLNGMRLKPSPRLKNRPCKWTFIPMISWDGYVRACACRFKPVSQIDYDELIVGDLKKETLQKIWFGEKVKRLRRRFIDNDIPEVCKSCSMYEAC
jgi:radical SAM protein with 4Fe4S-binding SPASM domain